MRCDLEPAAAAINRHCHPSELLEKLVTSCEHNEMSFGYSLSSLHLEVKSRQSDEWKEDEKWKKCNI